MTPLSWVGNSFAGAYARGHEAPLLSPRGASCKWQLHTASIGCNNRYQANIILKMKILQICSNLKFIVLSKHYLTLLELNSLWVLSCYSVYFISSQVLLNSQQSNTQSETWTLLQTQISQWPHLMTYWCENPLFLTTSPLLRAVTSTCNKQLSVTSKTSPEHTFTLTSVFSDLQDILYLRENVFSTQAFLL